MLGWYLSLRNANSSDTSTHRITQGTYWMYLKRISLGERVEMTFFCCTEKFV
jgi:hypothetical protein